MRIISTLTLMCITSLSGCFSQAQINRSLALKVSPRMSCPPDQIKISNFEEGMATFTPITYTATGCSRVFNCEIHMSPDYEKCEETEASKTNTLKSVAIDRLSLKSGCAVDQISVTQEGKWSSGQERAFRLKACGEPWLCTAAPGSTRCERAD